MENFTIYNPVKLVFGKNVISNLHESILEYGNKVLMIYGKESIKKNGLYKKITDLLKENNIQIFEYSGIKSNPIIQDVKNAIEIGIKNNVQIILAVGGGSVIDTAKIVSVCTKENIDPWLFAKGKAKPSFALPLITVLTLAATGTEMNPYSVIQNNETNEKIGVGHYLMFPKCSYLDPENTFSVSREYTAYGLVDIISHCLEAFFANGNSELSDNFICSIIKEVIYCSKKVLNEPNNYEYRERIMLASTCALNGITSYGKSTSGDWGVHEIGHLLSVLYDVPHGASLSIVYPAWLKTIKKSKPERIEKLGKFIFEINNSDNTILELIKYFKSINSPVFLKDINLEKEHINILNKMKKNEISGYNYKLSDADYENIIKHML